MQGQTCCSFCQATVHGETTWRLTSGLPHGHGDKIEISRPYVFSDCMPGTVVKSSLLGTLVVCRRQQLLFWGWSKEGLSLQNDPGSKITEVSAYVSRFISSERAKINQTVTVNSGFFLSLFGTASLRPNICKKRCCKIATVIILFPSNLFLKPL